MRIYYVYIIYTVCACITEFEKKEKFHAEYVSVITQERKYIYTHNLEKNVKLLVDNYISKIIFRL